MLMQNSLPKGGFPVIAETTRNHTFSKEISQVMLAAMVLAPDFYCKNCQRVISAMRGNPPQDFINQKMRGKRGKPNIPF